MSTIGGGPGFNSWLGPFIFVVFCLELSSRSRMNCFLGGQLVSHRLNNIHYKDFLRANLTNTSTAWLNLSRFT